MVSRVRAILRRVGSSDSSEVQVAQGHDKSSPDKEHEVLRFPSLTIDLSGRRVEVDRSEVALTPTEFDLLALLAQSPERVFTREMLMNKIWGYDYYGDGHIIDVHISALRKKIEANSEYRYIKTVWRVGYKFEVGPRSGT
jgi:two-component system response regulator ResD